MDDKTRASAAFRQKALAERFARLRDAVADGIAPPPFHTVVAEDGDMMIRPVELRAEQIGAADIHTEPILRAALDACHRCKQNARMGREPAAKTRLHGHAAQTGRLHDPGKFRLYPTGDGRDVGVALRAAMGHRETAAEAAIGHLQTEAAMQRRRAGEQGAGQRGKGLGIAQAKAEHGAQADLAHVTFCTPYVVLNVMPKLRQLDKNAYEAALDLGATPHQALHKVILPEIMPGIVTGAIMAFTMSIDDFVVSYFTAGTTSQPLSVVIYSMTRHRMTPKINAISTILFLIVLALLIVINMRQSRDEKRREAARRKGAMQP